MGQDTGTDVFRALQRHLDEAPIGYPPTSSGVELSLLKHLFTVEEARLAVCLSTTELETASTITERAAARGLSLMEQEVKAMLDRMMRKGTVLVYREGYAEPHYKNAGVSAGGMYDFQVNRLTPGLMHDFEEYHKEAFAGVETTGTVRVPQLRTVPVQKSIVHPEKQRVSSFDDIRQLIESARGPMAVANCICRQTKDLQGHSCSYTALRETCLQIGTDHARQYVEMGIGRYITREEAFDILDKAERDGLIVQPENSLRPEAVCLCCGDCCGLLSAVLQHPHPVDLYASNFYAEVDNGLCTGCGVCVSRCQLKARILDKGVAMVDLARCIGCGNCVTTCNRGAARLRQKETKMVPPESKEAMLRQIAELKKSRRT